ncbi:unnamed protein product [Arctia plantaginis]|uniref:Uncharacterized protein n=1 Tax=Arctia plantaginis TaxID=874455 RepID=A0A8S1B9D4_ARCPL|nr:unnamed protein product [Arctia plantaginis]
MPKLNIPSDKSDHNPPKRILTSKPFCDCVNCSCEECPDVLKMLSITVTTCHFGSKVVKAPESDPCESTKAVNPLDVINPNRSCNCDVVARGIRDHVHMNIGMSERRDEIKRLIDECDARCDQNCKGSPESYSESKQDTDKKAADSKKPAKSKTGDKTNICKICGSVSK